MTKKIGLLMIALAVALLPTRVGAVNAVSEVGGPDATDAQEWVLRVDYWHLWQNDGAELYREMCSSCHGVEGAGDGPAASALAVPAPALTDLERAGIPREHWTYVLNSACEEPHHGAHDGELSMPCWRRILRQALGSEAAPLLVTKKLTNYLVSIQQ